MWTDTVTFDVNNATRTRTFYMLALKRRQCSGWLWLGHSITKTISKYYIHHAAHESFLYLIYNLLHIPYASHSYSYNYYIMIYASYISHIYHLFQIYQICISYISSLLYLIHLVFFKLSHISLISVLRVCRLCYINNNTGLHCCLRIINARSSSNQVLRK